MTHIFLGNVVALKHLILICSRGARLQYFILMNNISSIMEDDISDVKPKNVLMRVGCLLTRISVLRVLPSAE